MSIIKWEPFKDLSLIHEQLNRMLEESIIKVVQHKGLLATTWTPPVDMYEVDDAFVFTVELPGMSQKDIQLEIKDDILKLKGERKICVDLKEENYQRMERAFGPFSRSFPLPSPVDVDAITASYNNGVLNVLLPKKAQEEKKKIKVNIA